MVRLAEQCLERRPPTTAPGDERPPTTAPALAPPRSTPRHSRVSEAVEAPAAFLPPEVFQKIQAAESQDSRKELTPIQEASRLNQKLKANYEARLSRLSPSQASQKTSLTLSLQRQMTENIIIARAREQICIIFGLQEVFIFCYRDALRSREQRVLYANILEYEQDQCECDWPKVWKANLKKNPNDATLVSGLLAHLLSCLDHPVMKLLKRLQCEVYQRLYPLVRNSACPVSLKLSRSAQSLAGSSPDVQVQPGLIQTPTPPDRENSFEDLEQFLTQMDWVPAPALKEHLKAIVKDVMMPSVDRCCLFACSLLNVSNTASAKDQCVACIEEVFFMPIWSPLLALFRKVHRERELAFENSVHLYRNASPGDVGVAPKLFPKDMTLLHGSYPYECAVQELKQLCRDHCPQRKLECIGEHVRPGMAGEKPLVGTALGLFGLYSTYRPSAGRVLDAFTERNVPDPVAVLVFPATVLVCLNTALWIWQELPAENPCACKISWSYMCAKSQTDSQPHTTVLLRWLICFPQTQLESRP
uniref:VPS9 domain containing 1 n=1 Tax=Electrophorus electricus TaxID=8005 RepID=A0AAY5ENV6_ELEEL